MKNKIYIILFCYFSVVSCDFFQPVSQNPDDFYIKMFGGEGSQDGVGLQTLNEEASYILGNTDAFGAANVQELYLIKVDKGGNQVWAKNYEGGIVSNEAVKLLLTEDRQHLLILANKKSANGTKIKVLKVDLEGDLVWSTILNSNSNESFEAANMSIIQGSSNFLIVGTKITPTKTQIYTTELDDASGIIWEKSYNFTDRKEEYGVAIMEYNGNALVLGRSLDLNGTAERPIIIEGKRTSIGEELQSKILFKNEQVDSVVQAKDMLLQGTNDFIVLSEIKGETYIIKTTINSEQSIIQSTNGDNPQEVSSALRPISFSQTQSGDLLVTGTTTSKQLGVFKFNPTTNTSDWGEPENFGLLNSKESIGSQVIEQADGSLLTVGTLDFSDKSMIGLIKTNQDGKLTIK